MFHFEDVIDKVPNAPVFYNIAKYSFLFHKSIGQIFPEFAAGALPGALLRAPSIARFVEGKYFDDMNWRNFRRFICFLIQSALCCVLLSCIKRDNPWDPYNGCHPTLELPDIIMRYTELIETVRQEVILDDYTIESMGAAFIVRQNDNNTLIRKNDSVFRKIESTVAANSGVETANLSAPDCYSAALKSIIRPDTLLSLNAATGSKAYRDALEIRRRYVDSLVNEALLECPRQTVLADEYIDSLYAFFDSRLAAWDSLLDDITLFNIAVRDSNIRIESVNRSVFSIDSATRIYNDSIIFCRMPFVTDPEEIEHRIDTIKPGETIAIGTESVRVENFYFKKKGADRIWTTIIGMPTKKTAISSERVEIDSSFFLRFENLIFENIDNGVGARILGSSDSIIFSNCVFRNNDIYGLEASGCLNIVLESCEFLHNGHMEEAQGEFAGMRISECRGVINIVNMLSAANRGFGVDINRSEVRLARGTICCNTIDGVRYTGQVSTGSFVSLSSVFAFNGRFGVYRNSEHTTTDIFVTSGQYNRFFKNSAGEMGGDLEIAEENRPFINTDPMFRDTLNYDYRIGGQSELYGKNIGYLYP